MLLSGTSMLFALTRSTSSQSCGTLARKVVRLFVKPGVAAILNKQFVTAGITNAGHWRRRKCNHQSFGNLRAHARIYFRQNRRQTLVARFSLRKFFEWKKHRSRVRLIAAEEIESREFDGVENAGRFVRDLRNLVDNCLGPIERSSVR